MVDHTTTADDQATVDGLDDLLDDDYAGPRGLPLYTVPSAADGTTIAYEVSGSGPPAVVVGGGLNDRHMMSPSAQILAERFTVYNYDRRGRGDSGYGDPDTYSIDTEVADLATIIEVAGGPCHVFGNCTGGIVAVHAAAAGLPIARLAMYEPPYNYPKITPDQMTRLRQLLDEDRRTEAVTLFGLEVVGFLTEETLENFKRHPAWQAFETNARSTLYDSIIDAQHSAIPFDLLARITAPTLMVCGTDTARSIRDACVTITEALPDARLTLLEGEAHLIDQKKVGPLVSDFFAGG